MTKGRVRREKEKTHNNNQTNTYKETKVNEQQGLPLKVRARTGNKSVLMVQLEHNLCVVI